MVHVFIVCFEEPFLYCVGLEKKACRVFNDFEFSLLVTANT